MDQKFAFFEFSKSKDEIPVKPGFMKHLPGKYFDFYIKKTAPCRMEEVRLFNTFGYKITLPLLEEETRAEKTKEVMNKILSDLLQYEVSVVMPVKNLYPFPDMIQTASGKEIFTFFLLPAITKALKLTNKTLKESEIAIVDGGSHITELALFHIYPHVNYLTLITDRKAYFSDDIESIYDDTGLNVHVTDFAGIQALRGADIIINSAEMEHTYLFKRGSVYFDLKPSPSSLIGKRQDILVADSLMLKYDSKYYPLEFLAMALSICSQDFRKVLEKDYTIENLKQIHTILNSYDTSVSGFMQLQSEISSQNLHIYVKNAGG